MKVFARVARMVFLVNGAVTLVAFLTATEGCHTRLPIALPLSRASDFTADSRGHVFVHSDFHRAVTEYAADGQFVRNLPVPGGAGRGLLAVDDADRLYVNKADLLAVYDAGRRLVETQAVPAGGERSWRLQADGSVTNTVGTVDDALAWTLRPRRAASRGDVLFVDWIRKRRPIGIVGNALLGDPFTGKDGSRYEYRGIFTGIVRTHPVASAPPLPSSAAVVHFRPSWLVALFTHPYSLVAWVIAPAFAFRAMRKRARRRAAEAEVAAVRVPPAGIRG